MPAAADGPQVPSVAIVHDYLTQRGGAERVVLVMAKAFPDATIHTLLHDDELTYDEFGELDVEVHPINRLRRLRQRHRYLLPALPFVASSMKIDADVVLCSSSGWAHGVRGGRRRVVYCYSPARWLYETDEYVRGSNAIVRAGVRALAPALRWWDRRAQARADEYVTLSTAVVARIHRAYGRTASIIAPPVSIDPAGPQEALKLDPGFDICVSRLLPYKNVDRLVRAYADLPDRRLLLIGRGPLGGPLRDAAPDNVELVDEVTDDELRWAYAHADLVVAVSYEDFGLTVLEGGVFGAPTVALRYGGYLDTVVEGATGVFVDTPDPAAIRDGIERAAGLSFDRGAIAKHAAAYTEERFIEQLRAIVLGGDLEP